jgi:hypothetical protein
METPLRQKSETESPSPSPLPLEAEDEASASDSEPESEPHQNRIPTKSRSPEPPAPPPQEGPKRPKSGLGTIGGRKKKEKEFPVPSAQARGSPKPQEFTKSPEKEVVHNDPPLPASLAALPTATKAKRLGKLGMIGGKSKAKAKDPVQDDTPLPTSESMVMSPDQGSPPEPKDTQDKKKVAKEEESSLPTLPETEKAAPVPTPGLETEDQRADRRREELKRTLEAKSKAPAKKKRRF